MSDVKQELLPIDRPFEDQKSSPGSPAEDAGTRTVGSVDHKQEADDMSHPIPAAEDNPPSESPPANQDESNVEHAADLKMDQAPVRSKEVEFVPDLEESEANKLLSDDALAARTPPQLSAKLTTRSSTPTKSSRKPARKAIR
eukprot:2033037-Rhodomonas_salina.1